MTDYPHLNIAADTFPRVSEAISFFREAHASINHVRKYTGERYTVHTEEVANTIAERFPYDESAIIAALGHDYKEDVVTKLASDKRSAELESFETRYNSLLNDYEKALVIELTDVYTSEAYPDKNRAARKELERERISKISIMGKNIKLADFLSNTSSIVENDAGFARKYLQEKEAVLPYFIDTDTTLLSKTGMQLWEAKGKLGMFRAYVSSGESK